MARVLVVEDEAALADDIAEGLRDDGFAVDTASDGSRGWEKACVSRYDVVVLDRDLPGLHGDEVCRRLIAAGSEARVLMLTAAGDVPARVSGLRLGADDYLPKPFAFAELVARIQSLLRRPAAAATPALSRAGIVLERDRRRVLRDDRPIELSKKEFGVLELLMEAAGRVVPTEELLERVWDEHADPFTNAVRVTVARLRRKLGHPPVVETVVGVGYRM